MILAPPTGTSTIWLSCGTRRDSLLSVKSKGLPYRDNQQALEGLHMIVTQQAASPLGFANPTFFGYDSNITTI